MQRYGVSISAGAGFQVWDREEHKIVARFKSFGAAQRKAKKLNAEGKPPKGSRQSK